MDPGCDQSLPSMRNGKAHVAWNMTCARPARPRDLGLPQGGVRVRVGDTDERTKVKCPGFGTETYRGKPVLQQQNFA